MSSEDPARQQLEGEFGWIPEEIWNRLREKYGPSTGDVDVDEEDFIVDCRDALGIMRQYALVIGGEGLPKPRTRKSRKGIHYPKPIRAKFEKFEFVGRYPSPRDWARITRDWNTEHPDKKTTPTALKKTYHRCRREPWSPEWEDHFLFPLQRSEFARTIVVKMEAMSHGEWADGLTAEEFLAISEYRDNRDMRLSRATQQLWRATWAIVVYLYDTTPWSVETWWASLSKAARRQWLESQPEEQRPLWKLMGFDA